jgi:hypothetical protein
VSSGSDKWERAGSIAAGIADGPAPSPMFLTSMGSPPELGYCSRIHVLHRVVVNREALFERWNKPALEIWLDG